VLIPEELGQVADAAPALDIAGGPAEHERLAGGGRDEAQEQLDRGGLARPVGAQEAEHLALGHGHGETGQRQGVPVAFDKLDRVNGG